MEAAECGAACLAMALEAHGRVAPLEEVREACRTSRDGVDAPALIRAAEAYGLAAKAVRREPETLDDLPLPAILHWRFDHFVVLTRVGRRRFTLLDPAQGRRVVDRAEMGRSFTGLAIALAPGPDFRRGGSRPTVAAALLAHARGSWDALALTAGLGLIGLAPALALSGAVQVFTDHVVGEGRTVWTAAVLAALLTVALTQAAIAWLSGRTVAALTAKIATAVAARAFDHALRLPLGFYAQRSAGEVVARLRVGADIGATVAGPLARLAPNAVLALVLLAVIAAHDWRMGAVAAAVALASLEAMRRAAGALADADRARQAREGHAAGLAAAGFGALDAWRLLGREDVLAEKLMAAEAAALGADQRAGLLRAAAALAPAAAPIAMSGAVLAFGAAEAMAGRMSLGALLGVQVLSGLAAAPIAMLAADLTAMQHAAGALMRLDDLTRATPDPLAAGEGAGETAPPPADPTAPALALEGVGFRYGAGAPVFVGIDFALPAGALVALTGPSGAGKSTLARIAAGLAHPDAGAVRLMGRPVSAWPRETLRRRLGYVPQDSAVFTGTLAENLSLFDADAAAERLARALEAAGAGRLLGALPGGLGAALTGHAPALSGGEAQRVALARALAGGPAALILDETTSALDPLVEAEILDRLRASGAAVLLVTHRPSAMARCDGVFALDGLGGGRWTRPLVDRPAASHARRSA
ncbi:MAG: ATP-binding cassette domain-containing protein [Rhodobacteraceae bacterium]|nr:MAG: ATP-binding cassette domain-containing protein [Paracoccaceae bacterium]